MNKLRDYFGNEINVGDIVLGATARRNHFQDTSYSIAVVIGRTKGMLRLHKLGEQKHDLKLSKKEILERVESRYGRKGGRVLPGLVISLNIPTGITQQEFDDAVNKQATRNLAPNNPFSALIP